MSLLLGPSPSPNAFFLRPTQELRLHTLISSKLHAWDLLKRRKSYGIRDEAERKCAAVAAGHYLSPRFNRPRIVLVAAESRFPPSAGSVQHLQDAALLLLPHTAQVVVGALQPADLLFHADGAAVATAHEGAHQLAAQGLQVALERDELAVVVDQQAFVLGRLRPHRRQQVLVLLVLAQRRRVRPDEPHPQRREELAFQPLLRVGFADHGALQVQELPVDRFEQREERRRVGQLAVDAFFQHAEELVERPVQCPMRVLGVRGPEEFGENSAHRCWQPRRAVLEDADPREEGVQVGECG